MVDARKAAAYGLTRREREVLALLPECGLGKSVAHRMGLSVATVKCHSSSIIRKLKAVNMTQAMAIAFREGLLQ